ncbi:DnaA regulatory inactivator Hda [Dokdonella immobilis]|uniref:Regulatory inactivation of DnaA Hda protein n=1 Tax=Dokdonella immobilis TaxID=578942 RepID=A0A1I4XDN0_9GAMM|nr:DnaA regulatory inactivator Hda [Dokdonella immobilis]SFN23772.1 regulatory inactivation of DnaA Hda protein [Dokdonella immobilis]
MSEQLPLALRWPAHQRFETFLAGANADGIDILRHAARGDGIDRVYLCGARGSGKTHLLVAACAEALAGQRSAQYLDLARVARPVADTIRRFGGSELLAIDNVDAIVGARDAEHALFDLYNRCLAEGSTLLFAGSDAPAALGLGLADLVSRLGACTQWLLRPLDEASRRRALQVRAADRGIELDENVLDWLFARQARDLGTLVPLLDRIDRATLAAQRRVTIPFLRQLLDEAD